MFHSLFHFQCSYLIIDHDIYIDRYVLRQIYSTRVTRKFKCLNILFQTIIVFKNKTSTFHINRNQEIKNFIIKIYSEHRENYAIEINFSFIFISQSVIRLNIRYKDSNFSWMSKRSKFDFYFILEMDIMFLPICQLSTIWDK